MGFGYCKSGSGGASRIERSCAVHTRADATALETVAVGQMHGQGICYLHHGHVLPQLVPLHARGVDQQSQPVAGTEANSASYLDNENWTRPYPAQMQVATPRKFAAKDLATCLGHVHARQ